MKGYTLLENEILCDRFTSSIINEHSLFFGPSARFEVVRSNRKLGSKDVETMKLDINEEHTTKVFILKDQLCDHKSVRLFDL